MGPYRDSNGGGPAHSPSLYRLNYPDSRTLRTIRNNQFTMPLLRLDEYRNEFRSLVGTAQYEVHSLPGGVFLPTADRHVCS
jgi:hypothetical protein